MNKGLLVYSNSNNIGDFIQSLAAAQYFDEIEYYIDRDYINDYSHLGDIDLIFAGWFMHTPHCGTYAFEDNDVTKKKFIWCQCHESGNDLNWPPPKNINPVFVSFNISNENLLNAAGSKEYLIKHGPIGCRDYHTLEILQKHNIPSFFSGCLTLTLKSKFKESDRTNKIYVVDCPVPDEYKDDENVEKIVHTFSKKELFDLTIQEKLDKAQELLDKYATAKLVITSRLHCMAPCLAFNTPIIWLPKHKAGGDTSKHNRPEFSSNRYKGIEELIGDDKEKTKVQNEIREALEQKLLSLKK